MLYIEDDQEGIAVLWRRVGGVVLGDQQEPIFDLGPATGTDQPVGSGTTSIESMLMLQTISPDIPNGSDTEHRSRCEVGRTLRGGQCELPGEIEFGGALLCARHAKQAEIYERIDLLHGIVLSLEVCLRTLSLRRNRNRTLLLRRQRARAIRELDLAYEDLRRFENDDPWAGESGW